MNLASEKFLNRNLFLIQNVKGNKIDEYPIKKKYKAQELVCKSGKINSKTMMVMDIICKLIIHKRLVSYGGGGEYIDLLDRMPTQRERKVKFASFYYMEENLINILVEKMKTRQTDVIPDKYLNGESISNSKCDRLKQAQKIIFTDSFLRKEIPCLSQYSSAKICKMIQDTAESEIIMNFFVRFFTKEGYKNLKFENKQLPSRFFRIIDINNTKVSSNNNILEREYILRFDTILGYFFIQNCISCYTDFLPNKFYLMSDYAQLLYRFLILPYFGNFKMPLRFDEIQNRLSLKSDTYMARKTIRRIFDELEAYSFIKSLEEKNMSNRYYYLFHKCSWKEINQ